MSKLSVIFYYKFCVGVDNDKYTKDNKMNNVLKQKLYLPFFIYKKQKKRSEHKYLQREKEG